MQATGAPPAAETSPPQVRLKACKFTSHTCRITRARSEDEHDLERKGYIGPNATPLKPGDQTEGDEVGGKVVDSILGLHVKGKDDEQTCEGT